MKNYKSATTLFGAVIFIVFLLNIGVGMIRTNQNKKISVAEGRIVFSSNRGGTIFLLKNGLIEKLVDREGGWPRFSPNGNKIYFGTTGKVFTYDLKSKKKEVISQLVRYNPSKFDISPDGSKIVFISFGEKFNYGMTENLFVINIDGTGYKQLTFFTAVGKAGGARGVGQPRWSPDGQAIVFEGPDIPGKSITNDALYTIKSDGADMKQIVGEKTIFIAKTPNWSPDSKKVVFRGLLQKKEDPKKPFYFQIFIANSDGTNIRQITHLDSDHYDPVFSPDGKQIAYSSFRRASRRMAAPIMNNAGAELFVINIDGTNERRITPPGVYKTGIFPWNVAYATDSEPDWHS